MTKQEKTAGLGKYITTSKRDDETVFNHFSDSAPEELKDLFLEHYNVKDLDYEIFGRALDIVDEVYGRKPERSLEGSDDEIVEEIYEAASDSASVYTHDRLAYLDNQNEDEISQKMREYGEHSIATACAIWYDSQVEQAAIIIKDWIDAA